MSATMSSDKADTPRLSWAQIYRVLLYGLPAFALSFPLIPFAVYLPAYYADNMALGFTAVAVALFLSRLIDMISDPLVGRLSDRTRNGTLRRKGWMAVGALVAAIALVQLCRPGEQIGPLYLGGWSAILYIGWTMIMIPYLAWGADLAQNDNETTRYTASREAFGLIGMVCALALPFLYEGDMLAIVPDFLIPVGAVCLILVFLVLPTGRPQRKAGTAGSSLLAIARTPDMRAFGGIWFLTATASAVPAALFPIYVSTVLMGSDGQKDMAILIYFAAAVLAVPCWAYWANGKNKKRIMATGMAAVCLAFPFATVLGPGQVTAFYAICVITGFALAAELAVGPAVLADIANARSFEGHDEVASHFAIWGMISKLAFAFAILLAFGILGIAETVSGGQLPPLAIALVYALLPTVLKTVATAKLWRISAAQD